jgi:hypothetical protein
MNWSKIKTATIALWRIVFELDTWSLSCTSGHTIRIYYRNNSNITICWVLWYFLIGAGYEVHWMHIAWTWFPISNIKKNTIVTICGQYVCRLDNYIWNVSKLFYLSPTMLKNFIDILTHRMISESYVTAVLSYKHATMFRKMYDRDVLKHLMI